MAKCKDSVKEFEKEAPLSTSFQFLYAIGNGDVWRLTELVMTRHLGKEVSIKLYKNKYLHKMKLAILTFIVQL